MVKISKTHHKTKTGQIKKNPGQSYKFKLYTITDSKSRDKLNKENKEIISLFKKYKIKYEVVNVMGSTKEYKESKRVGIFQLPTVRVIKGGKAIDRLHSVEEVFGFLRRVV